MKEHPIQPIITDDQGVKRFKRNAIVDHLLLFAQTRQHGLNEIACIDFPQEDREQFAQLIGYSLSGYSELSYVRDETIRAVDIMECADTSSYDAKRQALLDTLEDAREAAKALATALFNIHPDDLHP